jgi:uncharacterized protein (DUF1330 family)
MAAYLIAHRRKVTDAEVLKKYAQVDASIAKFGGEIMIRSDAFDVLEGDWVPGRKRDDSRPERLTVIRFADMTALRNWYDSRDYADLKSLRQHSAATDIVAVEAPGTIQS